MRDVAEVTPEEIISFWYPDGLEDAPRDDVLAFWRSRMHGGMDEAIIRDYADVAEAAAAGHYDHWADDAWGRLALILVLDQFPRSLWRDTPKAYGQDIKATRLALEGLKNGHYEALPYIFHRQFYVICISHCEGPDHLERMDLCVQMNKDFAKIARPGEDEAVANGTAQAERVRGIIERFGRHPHRNPIYGRVSTPDELTYIETGDFPHVRKEN